MLSNLNHLTLAVRELDRSIDFYANVLGCRPLARWDRGAYLCMGELWLCLSLDRACAPAPDYTHYAFSIAQADIAAFSARLLAAGARAWKDNASEGASLYFLDPDGHKLEAHHGDVVSRLAACRQHPYPGMHFF